MLFVLLFKNTGGDEIMGDVDRGLVKMRCDKKECDYKLPHYHCVICDNHVNSDEKIRDYHPCCSLECIQIYNTNPD